VRSLLFATVAIILTAAGVTLLATGFIVLLIATPLAAVLAMFFAAGVPNRVGQDLENLNGCNGVVAIDHQLTAS